MTFSPYFCNAINFFHIAHIAINMYRNNSHCVICDQIFKFLCINRIVIFFDITEYRYQTVSNNRMCCGKQR